MYSKKPNSALTNKMKTKQIWNILRYVHLLQSLVNSFIVIALLWQYYNDNLVLHYITHFTLKFKKSIPNLIKIKSCQLKIQFYQFKLKLFTSKSTPNLNES